MEITASCHSAAKRRQSTASRKEIQRDKKICELVRLKELYLLISIYFLIMYNSNSVLLNNKQY